MKETLMVIVGVAFLGVAVTLAYVGQQLPAVFAFLSGIVILLFSSGRISDFLLEYGKFKLQTKKAQEVIDEAYASISQLEELKKELLTMEERIRKEIGEAKEEAIAIGMVLR